MKDEIDLMNSNDNFSIYEEVEISKGEGIDLEKVWIDKIPSKCPTDFVDNFYRENGYKILQKFDKVLLSKVPGTSAFKADDYTDVITSKDYIVNIYDSEDFLIPYGISGLEVHSDYITFKKGLPEGYKLPFYASFVKYVGRKAPEVLLQAGGGKTEMEDDYWPQNQKSIVTKEYADRHDDIIENLIPDLPISIEEANLYVKNEKYNGILITSSQPQEFIELEKTIEIESDKFLKKDGSIISLLIYGEEISSINTNEGLFNNVISLEELDYYEDDIIANNFYKSYKANILLDKSLYIDKMIGPMLKIKLKQTYLSNDIEVVEYSKECIVYLNNITAKTEFKDNGFDKITGTPKYISGVPSLNEDQVITFNFELSGLNFFMNEKLCDISFENELFEFKNDKSYENYNLTIPKTLEFSTPENSYNEKISLKIKTYNVLNEEKDFIVERNIRFDHVSDESLRLKSGLGLTPQNGFGDTYDSSESLELNEELQLINGIYKWPEGDYSIIDSYDMELDSQISIFKNPPNYDLLPSDGIRWATFKYEITNANGVYVSLFMPENITMNKITKETNWDCYVKVATKTGWLNGNIPYDGYGNPREDSDPAMVIYNSDFNTKYITFGNEPISGTLYVRIGLKKDGSSFKGVDITVNNK